MPSLSLRIPKLSESLEDQLESMILSGVFWPQTPLPSERKLAEELDVSRTSVRVALAGLAKRELLVPAKRGYTVSNSITEELSQKFAEIYTTSPKSLITFWASLAADVAKIADQKAKNSDRVSITSHFAKLVEAVQSRNIKKAQKQHLSLWRALSEATYNFFLIQTIEALYQLLEPLFISSIQHSFQSEKDVINIMNVYEGLVDFSISANGFELILTNALELQENGNKKIALPSVDKEVSLPIGLIESILHQPYAFESVFELRLLTEIYSADWAAHNISNTDTKRLSEHFAQMTLAVDVDSHRYSILDSQLHALIAEISQSPANLAVQKCLNPIFSRTTETWLKTHFDILNDYSVIHIQHQRIVEAIVDKNPNEAKLAMEDHLKYVLKTLDQLRVSAHFGYVSMARQVFRTK